MITVVDIKVDVTSSDAGLTVVVKTSVVLKCIDCEVSILVPVDIEEVMGLNVVVSFGALEGPAGPDVDP